MKYTKIINESSNKINTNIVYDVLDDFLHKSDSGWYMQGGCYELAHALGECITELGGNVKYWEYGSDREPEVHVAVEYNHEFFDGTLQTKSLQDILNYADIHTDTKCSWYIVNKSSIPLDRSSVDKIKKDLLILFKPSLL